MTPEEGEDGPQMAEIFDQTIGRPSISGTLPPNNTCHQSEDFNQFPFNAPDQGEKGCESNETQLKASSHETVIISKFSFLYFTLISSFPYFPRNAYKETTAFHFESVRKWELVAVAQIYLYSQSFLGIFLIFLCLR